MMCWSANRKKITEKTIYVNAIAGLDGKETVKKEKVKTIWRRGTLSVVLVLLIKKKKDALEHKYHITF